jgi:Tol biopolymer transport system component
VQIYVLASDGSSNRIVAKGDNTNESPAWAEDGSHILFVSDREDRFGLYAVPVQNGERKAFRSSAGFDDR